MHWAQRTAQALVAAHPDRETFVCASGISPSGSVHIGNFREVVTTYFVVRALQALGKKTRFIFSWDDFDRFRTVPAGIDPSYSKYIGMPYSAIPDPHGCCESYAKHYEKEFEEALVAFGINVEFLYQTQQYQSGRYREGIHRALVNRGKIYDILMGFKIQEACAEERARFFPINLYCHHCGKDDTTISAYDEGARVLYYHCACGHHGEQSVRSAANIKLMWKVDWPMRWVEEQVVFEPGGRDHSAATGSYNVSTVVAREIFNYTAPAYIPYEFIGIKGATGKMSSSTGINVTPKALMAVYAPDVILSIFLAYQPNAAFDIGMDQDVVKHHTTFERLYQQYRQGTLSREDQNFAMHLSLLPSTPEHFAPYSQLTHVLPLVAYDRHLCKELLGHHLEQVAPATYNATCDRVIHWIEQWQPERATRINKSFNRAYYVGLPKEVQTRLRQLVQTLTPESDGQQWMNAVYEVASDLDSQRTKRQQNQVFEALYHLLISRDQGPKLPLLVDLMGANQAYRLLAGTVR